MKCQAHVREQLRGSRARCCQTGHEHRAVWSVPRRSPLSNPHLIHTHSLAAPTDAVSSPQLQQDGDGRSDGGGRLRLGLRHRQGVRADHREARPGSRHRSAPQSDWRARIARGFGRALREGLLGVAGPRR